MASNEQDILDCSIKLNKYKDLESYKELVRLCFEHKDDIPLDAKFFLYQQITGQRFVYGIEKDDETGKMLDLYLKDIVDGFISDYMDSLEEIPTEERNVRMIIFVAGQLLDPGHSTSDLAFQWCRALIHLGYNVLLINTAEIMTLAGAIPFEGLCANYKDSYSNKGSLDYLDVSIPFFQCPNRMPDKEVNLMLLDVVKRTKPGLVISLNDIVFSALVNRMAPVYELCSSADMPRHFTSFRQAVKALTDSEEEFLLSNGFSKESVIRASFVFSLPTANVHYSREELGIPDYGFCIVIVGNRLQFDITEAFLDVLEKSFVPGSFLLIIGDFDTESVLASHPQLRERCLHIKYTDELLAVLECSDLYVNPMRNGGGTSALYALAAGKPIVTLRNCDVAMNAGEEFCVDSYEEMKETIKRYALDADFYDEMTKKALVRARKITDVEAFISEQIRTVMDKIKKEKHS